MYSLCIVLSLIAFSQAATVIPLQSSHVDVRQSGAEFSYNIQENHGIAAVENHISVVSPLIKAHFENKASDHAKEEYKGHHEEPFPSDQKAEARANADLRDLKKSVAQPWLLSPNEFHISYYHYPFDSNPVDLRRPIISFFPNIPAIVYPYTETKTS